MSIVSRSIHFQVQTIASFADPQFTTGVTDWSTQQPGVIVIDFEGTRMQVTSKPLGENWYAAFRIARACYMKLRDGMSKAELRRKCQVYLQCMKIQLEQNYH